MTNLKTLWFMGADQQALIAADFVLLNSSRELQAYTFNGTLIAASGNATVASTLSDADRTSLTGYSEVGLVQAGSDGTTTFHLDKWEFDGEDWAKIGNTFSTVSSNFSFPCVAALSSTRIALRQQQGLQAYDFDGTDWATVGNLLSLGVPRDMDTISSSRVITIQSTLIQIHDFDGTDWTIFASLSTAGQSNHAIVALTATLFALFDSQNDVLETYQLVGSTISQVGNGLSIGGAQLNVNMCALSATRVVFGSNSVGDLQAYDWDGSDWTSQGSALSAGVPEWNNLTNLDYLLI